MDKKIIGTITKPQALKGQFRVKPTLLSLKSYKKFKSVYIDDVEYKIESVSVRDTFVVFKLEGIDSVETAETYRNKTIYAECDTDIVVDRDCLDYDVIVDNDVVGKIIDIQNFGSKDVWTISGKVNMMLAVIDGLVIARDQANKTVTLSREILNQVAVYEN